MASNKNISDIDAQIEALKKKKQQLLEKEKEEKKKLAESRHKKIGSLVEKTLGEIEDITAFTKFLESKKDEYIKNSVKGDSQKADSLPLDKTPEAVNAPVPPPIDFV